MKKGFFISATSTNVGKTLFTAGLTLWLKEKGFDVIPMKPIQTGVSDSQVISDLQYVLDMAGVVVSEREIDMVQPYWYASPVSPHLAAEKDQAPYPSIEHIHYCANQLLNNHDILLVEGAGGLLVPIDRTQKKYIIDLIQVLRFEVILVVPSGLGTINQTCLSIEALTNRSIPIAGFVFNDTQPHNDIHELACDNAATITHFTNASFLGHIPFLKTIHPEGLLNAFNSMTALTNLL